jgi:hypothetical protein
MLSRAYTASRAGKPFRSVRPRRDNRAITTVAPVGDDAREDGVKAAAASALGRAVRGVRAMGLDDVTLKSIRMVPGTGVVVEILATDSEPSLEDSAAAPEPPARPGAPRI